MRRLLLLPVLALTLSSCAGDYSEYAEAMRTHSDSEGVRIAAQANAISEMVQVTKTETPMEATLLAVIGMMQVERLEPVPLNMAKPTTGADVMQTFVGTLPMGYAIGGMVWQSSILASELTGMTIQDSTVTNSFNPTSSVAGYGNASAVGATPPVVVEPFIVEPTVVTVPVAE